MDINEVLMTNEEVIDLLSQYYGEDKFHTVSQVNKAQCLKLLEWLEEPCLDHPAIQIGWSFKDMPIEQKFYYKKHDCPKCIAELKKALEG